MACWELLRCDVQVVLLSPTSPTHWPLVSQGGLALGDDEDSLVMATLAAGAFKAPRAPVRALSRAAGPLVERLAKIGVPFETKNEVLQLRRLPGMENPGAVFVETHTEMAIATALERLLVARFGAHFEIRQPCGLMSLVMDQGACRGVVVRHLITHAIGAVTGDVVIVAGGGPERVLGARCGHLCPEAPLAVAAAHGAVLVDMHLCQQHPATLATARGLVVPSAALRSEGARLWVPSDAEDERAPQDIPQKERCRFLADAFPGWAELVPDSIAATRARGHEGQLYLDLSHFPERHLRQRLGTELEALRLASRRDPTRAALPVSPAPLGLLGGLWIDHERSADGGLVFESKRNHATSIGGLYAAGGLASLYHGTGQLGGNRLLADLFGGSMAGRAAGTYVADCAASENAGDTAEEAVDVAERAHDGRAESGFGAAHLDLIETLREAAVDILGAQTYELTDTAAEIDDVEKQLNAMPAEARAGADGAAELHALEMMLSIAKIAARTAVRAETETETAGRWLARQTDDDIIVSERLEVDGRTIDGDVDEDGIKNATGVYGKSA